MLRNPLALLAVNGEHPRAHEIYHRAVGRMVAAGRMDAVREAAIRTDFPWISAIRFSPEELGYPDLDAVEAALATSDERTRLTNHVNREKGCVYQVPFVEEGAHVDARAELSGGLYVSRGVFIAPEAIVRLDEKSALEPMVIGEDTNLQDEVLVHAHHICIGSRCIIAHNAIIHGAEVEDGCTIYIKALIDTGAHLEPGVFVDAGGYIGRGVRVPANRYVAPLTTVLSNAAAEALPEVSAEQRAMAEHVLVHNQEHARRYVLGQRNALAHLLALEVRPGD